MNPVVATSHSHNSHQCSLNLRSGNFVFTDSDSGVSVQIYDRCWNRIFRIDFSKVSDTQRVAMFRASLQLEPKTRETLPPHVPHSKDFLRVVFDTLTTQQVRVNDKAVSISEDKVRDLCQHYETQIAQSVVLKKASPLRVIRLGDRGQAASLQSVSLGALAQSLEQLNLCDKPIWIDFNASDPQTRDDGLMRIAMALGIDLTNIAVCSSNDPSRVSRRRSDNWWHFCSMGVDTPTTNTDNGELLTSNILHTFVKGNTLVTIHRDDQYSVERIMADMLQGGFCANGEPASKDGKAIGVGHLYSVILASMAHRAEDIARRVVEDAAKQLTDHSVVGSPEQQGLAGKVANAVNLLQQFSDSYNNDVAEMTIATTLGTEYGFNPTYLAKHAGLVSNIDNWIRSIGTTVENFHRQWQTAMDLVQNKSAVILTRLLGGLGVPAAVTSLADLPITTFKGACVASISAALCLLLITLKPKLNGKRIQLG